MASHERRLYRTGERGLMIGYGTYHVLELLRCSFGKVVPCHLTSSEFLNMRVIKGDG
jgi:hypothetical protein